MKVIKGRLLAKVEGKESPPAVGAALDIVNAKGEVTGQVRVSKVQGQRFIARIVRGQARPGDTLELVGAEARPSRWHWGAGLSTGSNTIAAKLPTGANVELKGSGGGIDFVGDLNALKSLRVRLFFSYLPLTGTGTLSSGSCNGSAECVVKIDYASLRAQGHWVFELGKLAPFAGLGAGMHIPLSKTSNFIEIDQVSLTQTIELAAGLEFRWSPRARFSFTAQSLQFPSSSSVSVQQTGLAVHLLKAF
jgi:hypothetical protein